MATSPRSHTLLLIFLAGLAFGLRLYQLDVQSLWYDEGVTATLTQRSLTELTQWTARDIQPPLYYYIIAGWGRVAGWSEWSLRFVSAWWGVLMVPLMAQLAQRLSNHRSAAQIAALLTTLHPLFVYYSQEARMYTMVVALGILAGYLFWQATARKSANRWLWASYVIVAAAAVYTHYFAFFLLFAFAITGLFFNIHRPSIAKQIVGIHALIVLLFSAWVIPLLTQLTTDRSYWQGTFKVGEAIRAIVLRFIVGETVQEQFATPYLGLAAISTTLTIGVMLYAAWRTPNMRKTLWYSVSWLVIPTACVLLLAIAVPKFNVRYVMLALPGLILFWSCGASWSVPHLRGIRVQTRSGLPGIDGPSPKRSRGHLTIMTVVIIPLIAIFAIANHNWFTDHSFLKAQWREAAAYVRLHQAPGETVVLVSGHAWPVWDYYAPDFPAIHLPDLEILDVEAVLDFPQSGPVLRKALQDYSGAWLVNWQEEVVDPTGVVPVQLEWAGREKTFRSKFWEVGLRRFLELNASAIPVEPPLVQQLDANFGNQLILHGYGLTSEDELLLFWQLGSTADQQIDWQISLQTETTDGLRYYTPVTRRPTRYTHPVERWQPGEIVMAVIPADEWIGPAAMPGLYQLQLGVYDPQGDRAGLDRLDEAGQPVGKQITLDVTLREHTSDRPLTVPEDVHQATPEIRLHLQSEHTSGEPGQRFNAELLWYLEDSFTAATFAVRWYSADDNRLVADESLPLPSGQPLAVWPRHDWVRQLISLQVPLDLAPGEYLLALEMIDGGDAAARPLTQRFTVLPSTRSFVIPSLAQPDEVDLFSMDGGNAPNLRFLGLATAVPTTIDPGSPLTITAVWQAPVNQPAPEYDYAISAQLIDTSGRPAAQSDAQLAAGTSSWLPGQVVTQTMTMPTPNLSGSYRLIVAIYNPSQVNSPRLVTVTGTDFIELAPLIRVP